MADAKSCARRHPDWPEASRLETEALDLASKGRYEEAEPLYARAITIAEASDHYALAIWRSAYAQVLGALGRVDDSIEQHRKAVDDAARQDGPDSPTVVVTRYFLAMFLIDEDMNDEAFEAVAPSLESTCSTRYVLSVPHALALWRTGRHDEARAAAARALEGARTPEQRDGFKARLAEIGPRD